jgi:PAS domain S-box-containing protein
LAALVLCGIRFWPSVLLGAFLFNFFSSIPHAAALPIAIGNTASAVFGAMLLRRFKFQSSLERLRDVLLLIAVGGILGPVVAASVGVTALFVSGAKPWSSYPLAWFIWWTGDAMGVLIISPLLFTLPHALRALRHRSIEAFLLLASSIAATAVIFDNRLGLDAIVQTLALMVVPFVIWAAVRFQLFGSAAISAIVAGIAVTETARGSGPFVQHGSITDAILLQLVLAVIAGTGLVIASVRRERATAEDALETEQRLRAAADALQTSEQRFRVMAETSPDAVFTIEHDGRIRFVNQAAEQIFGYATQALIGMNISQLMPEYFGTVKLNHTSTSLSAEAPFNWSRSELLGIHSSGRRIPVELSFGELQSGNERLFTGYVRDITDRKRSERRLATEHSVTRTLSEATDLASAANDILRGLGECLGWEFGSIWIVEKGAERLRCIGVWHAESLSVPQFEAETRTRTFVPGIGLPGRVWCTGSSAWIPDVVGDSNFPRGALAAGEGLHGAFGFPIRVADQVYGVVEFFSRRVEEPDPELLHMADALGTLIGHFVHRKEAEAALRTSERLATAGRLAATIAHEINNPLESVTNLLYLLHRDPTLGDSAQMQVELAERELARAAHIARRTLTFYRENSKPSIVCIPELLDNLLEMYASRLDKARVTVEKRYQRNEAITAIPGELQQLFSNLLNNALDAMEMGGKLEVAVRGARSWKSGVRGVRVTIADTGPGVPLSIRKNLFQPFFTTKAQTGTGLGLWVVKQIVDKHSGTIQVRSRLGGRNNAGACFSVFIPTGTEQGLTVGSS